MDYFEYSVNRLKNYWFSKDQITGARESERIDPNLGYNLAPDAAYNQNTWYLGYGPITQNLGQNVSFQNMDTFNDNNNVDVEQGGWNHDRPSPLVELYMSAMASL